MLFRIEEVSEEKTRMYHQNDGIFIKKQDVDKYIAEKIRQEVNGSNDRDLLSYSKSLAVCLFKFNKFTDNDLHIYDVVGLNEIYYISHKNNKKYRRYDMQCRMKGLPLFRKSDEIRLTNFIIDISNNDLVDAYLTYYTGTGRKKVASPEKDCEVVVMNPQKDLVISQYYIEAIYILYALQWKYEFLCDASIVDSIIEKLNLFDFDDSTKKGMIAIIQYLHRYWFIEKCNSRKIYYDLGIKEHFSHYYDPILQCYDIFKSDDFEYSYHVIADYNNAITALFWQHCKIYLEKEKLGLIS